MGRFVRVAFMLMTTLSATVISIVPTAAVTIRIKGVKMKQIHFFRRNRNIDHGDAFVFKHKNTPYL